MENIKQKIIAVIILILVVVGLIWLTMFLKNKNTDTETGDKVVIALFTKKNPGTKQVKNQGSIGSENDNDLTGNDTTKPVSIIENIIQTITGNKDPVTTSSTSVSENKSIGQAIRDFFLGNDGLPASQTDFQAETQDLSSRDPLALFSEEEPAFVEPLTEEDDSIGRECKPKEYISKITRKNELEEQIKKGTRKKESLSDDEKDLIAWKPSKDEIDEDDMRRVLERNWDMWSYPTSYLKDCQWSGYDELDSSQTQNKFEIAKRDTRETFSAMSIFVGNQYTYQEAQAALITIESSVGYYKEAINDCKIIRGLFEDPEGKTTGIPGYSPDWTNELLEKERVSDEKHRIWHLHDQIRKDISQRLKSGDLKSKLKNDSIKLDLTLEPDGNNNQSALTRNIKTFNRNGKKLIYNPDVNVWRDNPDEDQFYPYDEKLKSREYLHTPENGKVCNYDESCGPDGDNSQSFEIDNHQPYKYIVGLPQSIWDILRQDRSKNLFCTLNKFTHMWNFQEEERKAGASPAAMRISRLRADGLMCDNNLALDKQISIHNLDHSQISRHGIKFGAINLIPQVAIVTFIKTVTTNAADFVGLSNNGNITIKSNTMLALKPYFSRYDYDFKLVDMPKNTTEWTTLMATEFTSPTYMRTQLGWFGHGREAVSQIIFYENRDNWYSLSPIKAQYDFFKDDE